MTHRSFIFFIFILSTLSGFASSFPNNDIDKLPEEFKSQAIEILKKYSDYKKNKTNDSRLYSNLIEDSTTPFFSKPGFFDKEECDHLADKNECQITGLLDNKTDFEPTGGVKFKIITDPEGHQYLTTFAEIRTKSTKNQPQKIGWISAEYISFQPSPPSYSQIAVENTSRPENWLKTASQKICTTVSSIKSAMLFSKPMNKNISDLVDATQKITSEINAENDHKTKISKIADLLSEKVGQCVLSPPNQAPRQFSTQIVYDQFALPVIQKESPPPHLKKENDQAITQQDLINIDALARTIYAEMAVCTAIGDQYPMAVARVIKNRELAINDNNNFMTEFVKNNSFHDSSKSLLCKVATSPVLLSAWNQKIIDFESLNQAREKFAKKLQKKIGKKKAQAAANKEINADSKSGLYYKNNDTGLLQTLCPPSKKNALCYTGKSPDGNSFAAWQAILKIATEAILFPEKFLKRTEQLTNIKHYTSNRNSFFDFKKVHPFIEGKQIDSDRCLNLWLKPQKK